MTDYKLVIEASILRALKKYLLRQPKTAKNEIIPFTFIYNPNNPNVFPIKKQTFDNFQYSKTMCNIFRERNLSMSQAPNLGRFLCRSKFESEDKNHEVKNFWKNCVRYPYLLKASVYQCKRVKKLSCWKIYWTVEAVTSVVFCQGCKEEYIGETGCLVKEPINVYKTATV